MTGQDLDLARIEANRALGNAFFRGQDRDRGGPSPELCAPGYRACIGGNPPMDLEGHDGFARMFYGAFADLRHDIEEVAADVDAVAVRFVLHGTHGAPLFGIPASGRSVAIPAQAFLRVRDGRVHELLAIFDEAGMLRQLGVLPSG